MFTTPLGEELHLVSLVKTAKIAHFSANRYLPQQIRGYNRCEPCDPPRPQNLPNNLPKPLAEKHFRGLKGTCAVGRYVVMSQQSSAMTQLWFATFGASTNRPVFESWIGLTGVDA